MFRAPHKKVLVVDDVMMNRLILEDILADDYEVDSAGSGREALEILKDHASDYGVLLLDLIMDDIDGFGVLEQMEAWGIVDKLPVIVITAESSEEIENKSLDMHAMDFIRKPFEPSVVTRRVRNVYDLFEYKNNLEGIVEDQTQEIREKAERIQLFNENMINVLGMMVEYRNSESGQHVYRVKAYTELVCNELMKSYPEYGLAPEDVERIASASVLHDLGKIAISDTILLKPGRFTPEEFEIMKKHTVLGDELISKVKGAWDDDFALVARQICRHHHERYDGKGYPDGLVGEDIPIAAQVVSLADVYDALVTDRVYKAAYTPEVAYNMIQNGECGTFSPKILKCFEKLRVQFEEVRKTNQEEIIDVKSFL